MINKYGFNCISASKILPQTGNQLGEFGGGSILHESIALAVGNNGLLQVENLISFFFIEAGYLIEPRNGAGESSVKTNDIGGS